MIHKIKDDTVTPVADSVLIVDIETDSLNTELAEMKWFGAYSFKTGFYYHMDHTHREEIQKLIDSHKIIVGYNSKEFDIPIMENMNNNFNFEYKIQIDLMRVLFIPETRKSVRELIIKVNGNILKNVLKNHKLKTVAETFGLSVSKGDIDYNIFKKPDWDKKEVEEIVEYLHKDVKMTKELFEKLYNEFIPFKQYMSEDDKRKYNWFRTSPASMVYKIVCNKAGLEEEYEDRPEVLVREKFKGGLVLSPKYETVTGDIICFDFASLYPSIMIQCNLFSTDCDCCTEEEKWSGDGFFDVQGAYCSRKHSEIEKFVKDLFEKRMEWKKEGNTSMVYTAKIILNSLYGASSSPLFKSIHTKYIGPDTTSVARTCLKTAIETFETAGYDVVYGDTDSCYVKVPNGKTTADAEAIASLVIKKLQAHMPFPF